ncbi:FMN-dependent NADH-azoreductase [Novosphingobium sp.]|uniref:FMN-dependent NADH-azoreductase n=1 Tax=Novosphingobium sp. TaxID=1874826 RepID=UPI003BA9CCB0
MSARILHVIGSPRGERSRSVKVAERLIGGLVAASPDVVVVTLDLGAAALPALTGPVIEGRYALIEGREVADEVRDAWERIGAAVAHFLSFGTVVFSVPMWNFGIPWQLKQYIDTITQPGMAFRVSEAGVEGLGAGKRAILVASGALDIRPDSPGAELDHQVRYMQAWLGFIGITDVHVVHLRPTYGPPEAVETAMAEAYASAEALVADLSRAPRV